MALLFLFVIDGSGSSPSVVLRGGLPGERFTSTVLVSGAEYALDPHHGGPNGRLVHDNLGHSVCVCVCGGLSVLHCKKKNQGHAYKAWTPS